MNMDLFQSTLPGESEPVHFHHTEDPEARAKRRIRAVLEAGHPAVLAYSSGKDSSTLVSIALNTARDFVAAHGDCPPIALMHGDTLVEQPEITQLARAEIAKMQEYAKKHGIPLYTKINVPQLATTWPVRVIGGRALPSFPDTRADCSTDWKVINNLRGQRELFQQLKEVGSWNEPVVMTGVRQDESVQRDQNIAKRGEVADGIWRNEMGALRISPILDFTVDDVWEYIGLANAGVIESFSDFAEVIRIYRAAGGSSCVVVADMKAATASKPCGVRTGCWACTRVAEDKSMAQMIESDPQRYGRLKPLAALRDFISRTQYDWSRRTLVGRSIDSEGYITIQPDTYSPRMLEELLRYTLSAQIKSGVPIISIPQLIAIDARWSQYALFPPFTALKIYNEVMDGNLSFAPEVKRFPKTEIPRIGKIYVGSPTYNAAMRGTVSGLRNIGAELFHESCGQTLKSLKDGSLVIDVEAEDEIAVDEGGAEDFLTFIADDKIKEYCHHDCSDWTWAYKTYVQYETISIAKGRSTQTHEILQRSQWRQQNNLHGQQERQALESRCDVLFTSQLELI